MRLVHPALRHLSGTSKLQRLALVLVGQVGRDKLAQHHGQRVVTAYLTQHAARLHPQHPHSPPSPGGLFAALIPLVSPGIAKRYRNATTGTIGVRFEVG